MFCVPQKDGKRKTRLTHPKEWSNFIEYCRLDVEAERELGKKLPKWNNSESELKLYKLDQKINTRGFAVDIELANAAIAAVEAEKKDKDARTKELTDGAVNAATQRDALLKHLLEIHGVDLPDLTISTLNRRLEDPDLPEPGERAYSFTPAVKRDQHPEVHHFDQFRFFRWKAPGYTAVLRSLTHRALEWKNISSPRTCPARKFKAGGNRNLV